MANYALKRLIESLLALVAASVVVFLAVYAIGSPGELLVSPQASPSEREELYRRLGLDLPLWRQYLVFAGNALQGDLGRSFVHGAPAVELILARLPATLELVLLAMAIALLLGIPLGLAAGLNPDAQLSLLVMDGTVLGRSLPVFWKGMMLVLVFSVLLGWLPAAGRGETAEHLGMHSSLFTADGLRHLVLPALNLAIPGMSVLIHAVAGGASEASAQDWVRYARAKGVRPQRIVGRHILRNVLITVVTVAGFEFASLVAFSAITESVFAWPGMGKLLVDSVTSLDRPLIVAFALLGTCLFVAMKLAADLSRAGLDPRVRIPGASA